MRRLVLLVHFTLDGFVAGVNGELDGFPQGEENLAFICQLSEEADGALMGRKSYELLESYWPTAWTKPEATKSTIAFSRWYNAAGKVVLSRSIPNDPDKKRVVIDKEISPEVARLKNGPGREVLVFGGPTVSRLLLDLQLIDDCWFFINPLIFGRRIPLFDGTEKPLAFRLLSTQPFDNGEVALHYLPVYGP